jgi:tRNA G10  N-methylase Trm11
MGYTITESDADIGVITATKMREAGSTVGKVALEILAILDKHNTQDPVYEDKQKFFVTVVNSKTKDRKVRTRVTFARITYDNLGAVMKIEKLKDTKLYAEFFDKLSQSVFLTANNI